MDGCLDGTVVPFPDCVERAGGEEASEKGHTAVGVTSSHNATPVVMRLTNYLLNLLCLCLCVCVCACTRASAFFTSSCEPCVCQQSSRSTLEPSKLQ